MKRQDIAIGGILILDGKALMIRRADNEESSAGYWEFPKGRVEWGEDPATALKREFLEETNLRIELDSVYSIDSHTYEREGHEVHFWLVQYMVHLLEGENIENLKLSPDHNEYKLVDSTEAKTLKMYEEKREKLLRILANAR